MYIVGVCGIYGVISRRQVWVDSMGVYYLSLFHLYLHFLSSASFIFNLKKKFLFIYVYVIIVQFSNKELLQIISSF